MSLELSKTQTGIISSLLDWYVKPEKQYLTLGGYAGTGKSTLLGYLDEKLRKEKKDIKIAYCAYTGKAATVLRRKLNEVKSLSPNTYVGTIHRLIYKAIVDGDDNIIGWEKIPESMFEYDLIVVDEASMISENIWNDLLSFGVPVLAVGDHGQLPPIEGHFNLMEKPELRLEEIYRQEMGNPIIIVSEIARKYGSIPPLEFSSIVKKFPKGDDSVGDFLESFFMSYDTDTMVLTGYNTTRVKLNTGIRKLLGFESNYPEVNDRVICLKNNANEGIFNGMTGNILSISKVNEKLLDGYDVEIQFDFEEDTFLGLISKEQFGKKDSTNLLNYKVNLFDFGYALTVHKAQGSQARRVVLFEERFPQMSDDLWRRWLYTGVTRAQEELYIIQR